MDASSILGVVLGVLVSLVVAVTALIKVSGAVSQTGFDQMKKVVEALQSDIADLKTERGELKQTIRKLEAEVETLTDEKNKLGRRVQSLEDLNSSKDVTIIGLRENYERLQSWAAELVAQLEAARIPPVKIKTGPLGKR
jgi:septal ring factor EnvC (AmiA/AmiB activator)